MTWILAIDTSGPGCGVALVKGDRPAGVERLAAPGTNRTLMPAIDRLCRQAGIGPRGLDGVAVALGPGSFTGLRIGLAAAKGLAVALDRPLAGVGTLDAVVLAARVPELAQVPTPVPSGASGGAGRPAEPSAAPEGAALPEALGAPPGPPGAPGGAGVWLVIRPARRGEYYVAAYRDEPGPAAHHAPAGGSGRGAAAAAPQRLWGPELLPAAVLRAWLAGPPVLPPPLRRPGTPRTAPAGRPSPDRPGPPGTRGSWSSTPTTAPPWA
ncbi:MAG TPA: tRNA (adenosine(37)-N6)-threonylcarbamoyltransferase complex dimerization subunit type 1 TsaB [Thermaerobacter sp.]